MPQQELLRPPATARAFRCRYRRQVLQLKTLDMPAQQAYYYTCMLYAYTCFVYCHQPGMSLSLMLQVLQLATHACIAGIAINGYVLCSHLLCYRHRPGMSLPLLPQVLQLATHACTTGIALHGYALCSHVLCYRHRPGMSLPLLPQVLQLTPDMQAQHYTCMLWGYTCFVHCRPGLSPLPSAGAAAYDA
jgi:hypothetical protein